MIILGTQYYRPPTPYKKYWKKDFDLMKEAGLNTIQLWAVWGWIEPEPDKFNFDDYDELVDLCAKRDLKVVISTIAEVQPFWIPRIFPDAVMVDSTGEKVKSIARTECNTGITPGGCTDYIPFREKMCQFLTTIAERYKNASNFVGWDCWNEIRWNVHTDGMVCFCPASMKSFKEWLTKKYGDLEGLNKAWNRRYSSWEDALTFRIPTYTYVENMDWCRFLGWRARETARWRYEAIKKGDPNHPILAHGGQSSILAVGGGFEPPLTRGNDWDFADELDGYGSSSFPNWGGFTRELFGIRLEAIKSACRNKLFWASELQGGASNSGYVFGRPVETDRQKRWVWSIYARGAKAVIFWCWRSESWGQESTGFGIIGRDGHREERIEGLKNVSGILNKHKELENYVPDEPQCAVITDDDNVLLNYCAQVCVPQRNQHFYSNSLHGYMRVMEKLNIPYSLIDSRYLNKEMLKGKKLLILPASFIVAPDKVKTILEFLKEGGNLFIEGGAESFDNLGFYNQEWEERPLMKVLGIEEKENVGLEGKEKIAGIKSSDLSFVAEFHNPSQTILKSKSGKFKLVRVKSDEWKGNVFYISTQPGVEYSLKPYPAFEKLMQKITEDSGIFSLIQPEIVSGDVWWRKGKSGDRNIVFFLNWDEKKSAKIEFELSLRVKINSWCGFLKQKDISEKNGKEKIKITLPAGKTEIIDF